MVVREDTRIVVVVEGLVKVLVVVVMVVSDHIRVELEVVVVHVVTISS